jgi:hypothetical protein
VEEVFQNYLLCECYLVLKESSNHLERKLARKLVVAFVNFYSVGSQFPTNPFNIQGYDLKHITVFVDGHPVGGNPIKMNFDDSGGQSVTEALLSLYQVTKGLVGN